MDRIFTGSKDAKISKPEKILKDGEFLAFKKDRNKKMKFREIKLETGAKFILGKDEESNDDLMNKFRGKKNIILHTSSPGSPFCVIKNKVSEKDVYLAAVACARYSQDWRDNKKDVKVNVFTGKEISKKKDMKPGTWVVSKFKTIIVKKEDILKTL